MKTSLNQTPCPAVADSKAAGASPASRSEIPPLDFGKEGFRPKRENWVPAVRTIQLSDNFLCFYIGRDGKAGSPILGSDDNNWGQFDLTIGTACYVLFKGKEAVVIDTLLLPEQARFVRWRLESLGVEQFTVINTHMDMDHTGGNAVFADSTIIASKGTYAALVKYKDRIESGTMFGLPATNPLVFPNKLIEKDTEINLAGFDLKLIPVEGHQEGGVLCTLVPAYQAMILGDLAEDNLVYVIQPQDIETHIAESRRLLTSYDFEYVFPGHGSPDRIARGEYRKRLLEAAITYQERLVQRVHEPDYLDSHLKDFMADYFADGTLEYLEPYAAVHRGNTKTMYRQYNREKL